MSISDFWKEKYNEINYLLKVDNINNFLNWKPITETMFINYNSFTKYWINDILPNERWKKLLDMESSKGSPMKSSVYNCSDNQIAQVYHLMSLVNQTKCDLSKIDNIVEIGAGYGLLAKTIYNYGYKSKYHIYDNELMNLLQKFYLDSSDINYYTNLDFMNNKLDNCLFISNWSISEMPLELRELIMNSELFKSCKHYLICFQSSFENNNNLEYFSKYFHNIESLNFLPENYRIIL